MGTLLTSSAVPISLQDSDTQDSGKVMSLQDSDHGDFDEEVEVDGYTEELVQ